MNSPQGTPQADRHPVSPVDAALRSRSTTHARMTSLVVAMDLASSPSLPLDVSARFGMRLRQLRREHTLTQSRMASTFGIDRSFISDVERGRKSISLHTLEIIAIGLNMTLSELLKDV